MIPFVIVGLLAVIVVIAALYYYSGYESTKRMLRKTPKRKIGSFKDGEVGKIVGKVQYYGTPLIAPLYGNECVYYRVVVKENKWRGRGRQWRTIIDKWEAVPFVVWDDNETALIAVDPFIEALENDIVAYSGTFKKPTDVQQELLKQNELGATNLLGLNRQLSFTVTTLERSDKVAVWGEGQWNEDNTILHIGAGKGPVLISDAPKTLK